MTKSILKAFVIATVLMIYSMQTVIAQKKGVKYLISDIPPELLIKTNAIIRDDVLEFEVFDKARARSYTKMAVTIINKKADHYAEMSVGYDERIKIKTIEAQIYDKLGKIVKTLKNKDIEDYSAYDGYGISDNRIKHFDLRYPEYPYTIEYIIEKEYDGILSIPGWAPYSGYHIASEKSSYKLISPTNYDIRYKELNMELSAHETTKDGKTILSWKFGQYLPIKPESNMPPRNSFMPLVLAAPSEFEMEKYAGDMSDWSSFATWERELNVGRDELPNEFIEEIKGMTKDESSRSGKIKLLYDFLQERTRYVSIQLGIGGWQSFPAMDVHTKGYGDCKALTNYMKAMLKHIDVESYYTLVRAGKDASNIMKEFPSNQFNHMMLCIPNYQDTIWLECTSQDSPFGFIGSFTGDRDVLVINDDGGKIVHTKVYNREDNRQIQKLNVVLSPDGNASVQANTICTGLQFESYDHLLDIGQSDQKKWLYKNLDLSGFTLNSFEFDHKERMIPEISLNLDLQISRYASVSGKRLFFQPNVLNKSYPKSIPQKERKYEFELDYPYVDTDTVIFEIPDGYHMEYIPEKTEVSSDFGEYENYFIAEENRITYIRNCSMKKGMFPAKKYMDYVKFRNKIAEKDKMKIVLVKST